MPCVRHVFNFRPGVITVTVNASLNIGQSGKSFDNRHSCSLAIPGLKTLKTEWVQLQFPIIVLLASHRHIAMRIGL